MGTTLAKPLCQLKKEELASAVASIGSKYEEYAESVRENGVDGAFLEEHGVDDELLTDLEITHRLHKKVILKEYKKALEQVALKAVQDYDLTSSTPREELKPFEEIADAAYHDLQPLYAGVHLLYRQGHLSLASRKTVDKNEGTVSCVPEHVRGESMCRRLILEGKGDYTSFDLPPEMRERFQSNDTVHYQGYIVKENGVRVGMVCILSESQEDKQDLLRQLAHKAEEQLHERRVMMERSRKLQDQIDEAVIAPAYGPLKPVTRREIEKRPCYFPYPSDLEASGKPRRSKDLPILKNIQASPEEMKHLPKDYFEFFDTNGLDRTPIGKDDMERIALVDALGIKDMDPKCDTVRSIKRIMDMGCNLFGIVHGEIAILAESKVFGLGRDLSRAPADYRERYMSGLKVENRDADGEPFLCSQHRCYAPCNYPVSTKRTFVVHDVWEDESFAYMKEKNLFRFYSGAPIILRGIAVGSFCMMDNRARPDFGKAQEIQHEQFAQLIAQEIDNWVIRRDMERLEKERQNLMAGPSTKTSPPQGEAALLFTDVQGSTSLWEADPDAMQEALVLHDKILRKCCADHYGYEVQTEGDAFHIAFHDALDAVGFALDAQEALYKAPWEPDILALPDACDDNRGQRGLRVRMAIHFGPVDVRDNQVSGRCEYTGSSVHIAKSLEHMSHGGQILVSADVWNIASYLAEAKLNKPQVLDMGTHILLKGKKQDEGVVAKGVLQLVPASLAFDYFGACRTGTAGSDSEQGRKFPPVMSQKQLSASFHDAPQADNNVVTILFVYTSEIEKRFEDSSVKLALLAKFIGSLLTDGYQCKDFMIAFPSVASAVDFGFRLLKEVEEDLRGLLRLGVHEGTFSSMGPSPTTGRADYFGTAINRAARVAGACELGQIYVGTTCEEEPLPAATFVGWRALKGVKEEMALFRCEKIEVPSVDLKKPAVIPVYQEAIAI